LYRKDRYQTKWDKNKKGKETYIDMILMNAKRPDRYIPGPSDYKPEKVIIASTKLYKWSTEKRNSIIDMI
jgi:hypothetical protein